MGGTSAHRRLELPRRRGDRWLLALGATALVAAIPLGWIWVLYASGFGRELVTVSAVVLSAAAAAIGLAMIRALDRP